MKRGVLLFLLAAAAGPYLAGHELSPATLTLRIGGPPGTFTLASAGGETDCTTTISISVQGNAITVSPTFTQYSTPPDTSATFSVNPVAVGTATITVSWIAGASPTCNGSGKPTATVKVADIPPPPTATQEKQVIEPVSMANGAEVNSWLDMRLRGPLPLFFERYYYSALQSEGQVNSALGPNWMHNYDIRLSVGGNIATVTTYHGQAIRFTNTGGVWSQNTADPLVYQLVQNGNTYSMLDPGSKLVYVFDGASGKLQSIQDRNGNISTFTYEKNLLTHVADGLGATLDFTYSGDSLTKVTDQSGRSITFTYAGGSLASFTDVMGKITSYRYSGSALLTSVTLPRGNTPFTQTYDSTGKVVVSQDAAGNKYAFSYNTTTGQSAMTDPLGQVSTFAHNSSRALVQETDPAGSVTTLSYDSGNRLRSRRDANGNTTTLSDGALNGLITGTTYPDGTQVAFAYTPTQLNGFTYYDLTKITYPDGATESFQYDQHGNVTARIARNGQQWTAAYNSLGQPLTLTAPNQGTIVFTYTKDGTSVPATIQFPDTAAVTLKVDSLKRLVSRVRSDGTSVSYTFDANDHVLSGTDELGGVTTYTYDANGLVASLTDPNGGTIKFTRTVTDQLATLTDAVGRSVTIRYDPLDRLASEVLPEASSLRAGYDAAGNLVSITDGEGKVWKQDYDKAGNITGMTTPLGARTAFTLDGMGRMVAAATAGGKKNTFGYDSLGRLTGITDALNNATVFTYDRAGALTAVALAGGISAQYTRDALEHVTSVSDPNGNLWQFQYDGLGRVISLTDPLGQSTTYKRDDRGHITGQKMPLGSLALTVDAVGRPAHAEYSDGTIMDYTRDKVGRLTSASGATFQYDASGRLTASNGLLIAHDPVGRVSQVTLAPGNVVQYSYDRRGLCTQVKDWTGATVTLQYDDASRLISITRPNGVTTNYRYDADSDVAGIQEAGSGNTLSSISLTRDQRGLIVQASRNVPASPTPDQLASVQTQHTFNAADQVAEFQYDTMGRRVADDTRSYTWDLASRLTGYAGSSGSSALLQYDGVGLLNEQTTGGVTFQFVWNHALYIPSASVVRWGGSDLLYFIHTPDGQLLASVDTNGVHHYYHYDEQGNTLFLTDDSGAITDQYAYTEYGALVAPPSSLNPFLFGGRYGTIYLGSGLYSMRQRVYDSVTGAFLSPEVRIHLAPHLVNPYEYAAGNPLLFTDVMGADPGTAGSAPVGTTAPDIVNGAGTIAGTVGTELNAYANTTEQLINMVDFENEGMAGAQAAIRGTKMIGQIRTISKPLNAAKGLGAAAKVVSVGINAYNLNNGINAAESEDDQNRAGAYQTYQSTWQSVQQLYDQGKITAIQRNNLKLQAQINYDEALLNLDQHLMDNLLYEGFNFFTKSMEQVPFVNDAAIWVGNQFYK